MKYSRKDFLQMVGGVGAGLTAGLLHLQPNNNLSGTGAASRKLKLGLASYTLRALSLDTTIQIAQQLDLKHIAFKSMHMPLDADAAIIESIRREVEVAGLQLYGAGVIYMKSDEDVNQAFDYATKAGLEVIIGVPNHDLLPLVERKVRETNVKVAIHNHGPGDTLYSSPDDIHAKVKDLDSRIGFCIDIGHVARIKEDPVEKILKYQDRLYDIHLKDVDAETAEGKSVEFGRGIIDLPSVLKTLAEIRYDGIMAIEFEKDEQSPVPGLAECVGYANGIMDALAI